MYVRVSSTVTIHLRCLVVAKRAAAKKVNIDDLASDAEGVRAIFF